MRLAIRMSGVSICFDISHLLRFVSPCPYFLMSLFRDPIKNPFRRGAERGFEIHADITVASWAIPLSDPECIHCSSNVTSARKTEPIGFVVAMGAGVE